MVLLWPRAAANLLLPVFTNAVLPGPTANAGLFPMLVNGGVAGQRNYDGALSDYESSVDLLSRCLP